MKTIYSSLFFIFAVIFPAMTANAQSYKWAKGGGSTAFMSTSAYEVEAAYKMCTDPKGNVYALSVVGNQPVTADTFYHGGGAWSINSFLFTSHTCDGQMRFAKLVTGTSQTIQGIVADSFGNIYLAADMPHNVSGATILRIGYDTVINTNQYQHQALVKYDTSGELQWIRFVGNNTLISFNGTGDALLALDSAQYPHLITYTRAGVVFRPGDTSIKGETDLRYDPSGNLLTVKRVQLDSSFGFAGLTIDPVSNKLYAYGEKDVVAPASPQYKFLAAFDTNRNLIWIDTLINPASISYGFTGVAADGLGSLYVSAGGYGGTTVFKTDTARNELTSSSTAPVSFVMKTDTAGNVNWMTTFSGTSAGAALYALTLSPDKKKVAIGGHVANKIKCGVDSITSYSGEFTNPAFAVLDTAGYVHELQQMHAAGSNDWFNAVVFDRVGSLYGGGRVDLNVYGGTITPYNSTGGDSDYFIAKYGVDCNCTSMPVANFTSTVVGSHTVNLSYTGSVGDSVRWYFGDGTTSTSLSPSHVYSASGTFIIRCWVYTTCGRDMKVIKVYLPCTYPGGASYTYTGIYNISFNYTGSMTDVDSIRWKFGDGGNSSLVSPTHAYAAPGTYNACVKVYSWCGVDSFCTSIVVPCVASPTALLSATGAGPSRNFNYTGTTTAVSSYSWDYGDMSSPGSGSSTSHTYTGMGVYTVCVTATNPCGTNTYCMTINVTCLTTPTSSFTKAGTLASRNFSYTGITAGADSVGWYFGDGGHATGYTPSHTYGSIGIFTVCAIAYSQCGNDTTCDTLFVPCLAAPTANFTISGSIHDSTKNFSYTGVTSGIDSIRWNFGDGNGYTGTTAVHSYSGYGTYTVCVVAYTRCGNDTLCDTVAYRSSLGFAIDPLIGVKVYPNPANSNLYIANAAGYTVSITDCLGIKLLATAIDSPLQLLDISSFSSGIYVIQIRSNALGLKTLRIVKQ